MINHVIAKLHFNNLITLHNFVIIQIHKKYHYILKPDCCIPNLLTPDKLERAYLFSFTTIS